MARFSALLAFLVLLAGCAPRRISTYRFVVNPNARILIPPGVKDATVAKRTITFPAGTAANRTCAISDRGLDIETRGRSLHITIQKEQIVQRAPGELVRWAALYEKRGCVAKGEGLHFATRIAETLPLDPAVFHTLLHADPLHGGYVDLGPESRLKVVSPILREGASQETFAIESVTGNDRSISVAVKPSSDFLGYETAWYKLEPKSSGKGVRFVFMSAEASIGGQVIAESRPRSDYFVFAPEAACFRLFFLTRNSIADHDIAILGEPTAAELDAMTAGLQQNPQACKECVMIPRDVAIVPHLAVTVNGKEFAVPTGTSVDAAIRASGEQNPERVLSNLQLRRPYANTLIPVTFDRAKPGILRLPLRGGEDLRW